MSLRSSTEYEIAAPLHASPTRHAGAGYIDTTEGMDTGFRRYDNSLAPSSPWSYLHIYFRRRHEVHEDFGQNKIFELRALRVFVV